MDRKQYLEIRKSENLSIKRWALLSYYLTDGVLVSLVFFAYHLPSFFSFAAIPIVATLIFRNFSLMHDAVHRAVSKNSNLNDLVGITSGAICLLPFEPWRRSHLEHHSWSGNLDRDPVMALVKGFPNFSVRLQNVLSRFWQIWIPLLAIMQYGVFYVLAAKVFLAKRDSFKVLVSLVAPIFFWGVALAVLPTHFSLTILLPAFFVYMIAVEVVNFPHHLQLPQHQGETRFAAWEQYKTARTCTYPKWFARLVVLNFNYHVEHHMFPDVPWYHLNKLHARIAPILRNEYNTDEQFAWIAANRPKHLSAVVQPASPASESENFRRSA